MRNRKVEHFGPNLRSLLKSRVMTYQELSVATGVPRTNIHDYAHNRHSISLERAFTLACYFDLTIDEMLNEPLRASKSLLINGG